jgi:hypothetical protein
VQTLSWEAFVPAPANNSQASGRRFWPSIVRIVLVEVLILLALSGAIVGYLNWSSEAAWAEFNAASKMSPPNSSIHAVKGHMSCVRSA